MINLNKNELDIVLDRLVPEGSPDFVKIQDLIIYVVGFRPNFALNINFAINVFKVDFTESECSNIATTIIKEQKIEEWAVSYMLVLFYQRYGEVDSNSSAWQFMSIYLQIIIRITMREDSHFAKVSQLGVRVRMGLNAHNPQSEIINQLIDIHAQQGSLENVLDAIRQYEVLTNQSETSGRINKKLTAKISRIRLAYEVVAEDKAFIGKTYSKSDDTDNNSVGLNKVFLDSDDEPLRATIFEVSHKNDNVSYDENLADDDPEKLLDNDFKPSRYTARSAELQQWKLKNNFRHARRNQFGFPTSLRQLSLLSIQKLFDRVWQLSMVTDDDSRFGYVVIVMSLLSGRKIQEVINELSKEKSQRTWLSSKKVVGESYYALKIVVNVTMNRRSHLLQHRQSIDNEFILLLPTQLQSAIENTVNIENTDISETLRDLKKQLDLPALNYQHIDSALYFIIKNKLNEPLHADLITGVDVRHSSPLYYTSIDSNSIENTYRRAILLMGKHCSNVIQSQLHQDIKSKSDDIERQSYIGSDMALNKMTCQKFFAELANGVESFNGRLERNLSIRKDRYIEQFNAYSVWLWHIIMIQTGIRPVVHAPGVLNQLDFIAGLFWVSDKEERQGQEQGRLIPLGRFLIIAIQNYIKYIKEFASLHNVIYPSEQFPIVDILNSRQPLIQIFSKNPKGFSGITPSRVRYQLKGFFSHQDNWLRHQLRSMLVDNMPEYLICALYGHEYPDQEAMHPMSSLSINELKETSSYLDEIACELNLKQIEVIIYV